MLVGLLVRRPPETTLHEDCACMQPPQEDKSVANFAALREQCLALRDLLLPDELWPQFEKCTRPLTTLRGIAR